MKKKTNNNAEVAITEQEFKTIKAVMERVGAEDIYRLYDALEPFYMFSHKKFFETQPVVLASLHTGGGIDADDVKEFAESLKNVNTVLAWSAENLQTLTDIAQFLYCMFVASEKYEKPN